MCENRADSIRRQERLVRQIMKEEDPMKFDELGEEIWSGYRRTRAYCCDAFITNNQSRIGVDGHELYRPQE